MEKAIGVAAKVEQAAAAVRKLWQTSGLSAMPRVAAVLGSGLGSFADRIEVAAAAPYSAIPHFPLTSVEGHKGMLVLGSANGIPLALLNGRAHGYEGIAPQEATLPVRVLAALGVRVLVLTSAVGAIRLDLAPGRMALLTDQINLTGSSPLTGAQDPRLGTRFVDMTEVYSPRLRRLAQATASEIEIDLAEGVYLGVSGPAYETPAEIRAFRILGADVVGMSIVHEAMAAAQSEMQVLGIVCVTNMAAGIEDRPIRHAEVIETAAQMEDRFDALLSALLPQLDRA